MPHIERMRTELEELKEKIKKGEDFLNKEFEKPKFTDETQRHGLHMQLMYMHNYADVLEARIGYDEEKAKEQED